MTPIKNQGQRKPHTSTTNYTSWVNAYGLEIYGLPVI